MRVEGDRVLQVRNAAINWTVTLLLVVLGILMLVPIYWTMTTSLSPLSRAFELPPNVIPPEFTLENYRHVFEDIPYAQQILNSLKITTIITVGILVVSTLAAYAFACLRFPGRDVLFVLVLTAMMVPAQMTMIPTFIILRQGGLIDSHEAIYLPALINAFSIFLLRQSFMSFPRELIDAARIDGASHLQVLWKVIVPNSTPVLAGIAVLQFQHYFNDLFWPLVVLFSPDKFTIPLGLVSLRGEFNTSPTTEAMAAITTVVLPLTIVFVFAQRFITQSFARTGIK